MLLVLIFSNIIEIKAFLATEKKWKQKIHSIKLSCSEYFLFQNKEVLILNNFDELISYGVFPGIHSSEWTLWIKFFSYCFL